MVAIYAVGVMVFTVLGLIFADHIGIPFAVVAWIGAVILVFSGTITASQATKSIDMSTLMLLIGTLSLGTALDKTGAGEMVAHAVLSVVGSNPIVIIRAVMLITIVFSSFMSNTATAALMAPIGLAIALGASSSYVTPFGSTPGMMVYGIGSFRFMDFVKVGLPLAVINYFVAMILMSLLLL